MIADAWATALNALGPERGLRLANDNDVAVMYIMQNENIIIKSNSWNFND